MYKKLLSSLLAIILLLGAFPLSVGAASSGYKQATYNGMVYKYYYDPISTTFEPATIIDYTGSSKNLNIPAYFNQYKVETIGSYAFENATTLETVTITEGPDYIGIDAFIGCSSLRSIEIPSSVTYLGGSAFQDCHALEYITLPDNITDINRYTFYNCEALKEVVIPSKVTTIWDYAFMNCISLEDVTIPHSVKTIKFAAFSGCDSLQNVTIPRSVTTIDNRAFGYTTDENNNSIKVEDFTIYGYKNTAAYTYAQENGFKFVDLDSPEYTLEFTVQEDGTAIITNYTGFDIDLIIPTTIKGYTVTAIAPNAFANSTSLESVHVPSTVTDIYEGAFNSSSIKSINVNLNNTNYTSQDGVLMGNRVLSSDGEVLTSEDIDILIAYPGRKPTGSYMIPQNVVTIAPFAFNGNTTIKAVTIHENVINIYASSFINCPSLENITVSKNNSSYMSFDGVLAESKSDTLLSYPTGKIDSEYTIPNGIVNIAPNAFSGAENLKSVVMADTVKNIGAHAFENCINLENVTLNRYIINIYLNAFYGCDSLKYIYIPSDSASFDESGLGFDQNGDLIDNFTIFGYDNSLSQNYATNNGFSFVSVKDNPNSTTDEATGVIINTNEGIFTTLKVTDTELIEIIVNIIGSNEALKGIYNIESEDYTGSFVQIKIPAENENSKIYLVDSNGYIKNMNGYYEDGYMVFITDSQGMFALVEYELILGDANLDRTVNVKDSTLIQKSMTKQINLSSDAIKTADVTEDMTVNITDATNIQKHIANIYTGYPIGTRLN